MLSALGIIAVFVGVPWLICDLMNEKKTYDQKLQEPRDNLRETLDRFEREKEEKRKRIEDRGKYLKENFTLMDKKHFSVYLSDLKSSIIYKDADRLRQFYSYLPEAEEITEKYLNNKYTNFYAKSGISDLICTIILRGEKIAYVRDSEHWNMYESDVYRQKLLDNQPFTFDKLIIRDGSAENFDYTDEDIKETIYYMKFLYDLYFMKNGDFEKLIGKNLSKDQLVNREKLIEYYVIMNDLDKETPFFRTKCLTSFPPYESSKNEFYEYLGGDDVRIR